MDPAWTGQARHVRERQPPDWSLHVCVELLVFITSLLLVLICMMAWIRTIVWALFGHRSAHCPEVARAVADEEGDGAAPGAAASPSSPAPPAPP